MIISRTPLRISFTGGGSDLPSFYRHQEGAVVSTTIDKYIYIAVNKKFDDLIRASYSVTEFAKKPEQLKHELIRESLLLLKLQGGIEVTSISDIPSKGTGLGSSGSYTVGLLNSLNAFRGKFTSAEKLARAACHVEIDRCSKPVGKQDQYAAAFGGLNFIRFNPDDTVSVNPIVCQRKTITKLQRSLLMLYMGTTRSSSAILKEQDKNLSRSKDKREKLSQMVTLARAMKDALESDRINDFGDLLHQNWKIKKKLASRISSPKIDRYYHIARQKGAMGGKVLGAGGGGFLLLYALKSKHQAICRALPRLKPTSFNFEPEGSRIIYYGEK